MIFEKCTGIKRITPAHAGTTKLFNRYINIFQDHPRSRGDYSLTSIVYISFLGSPPLTRGLHSSNPPMNGERGITPAHAGTTTRAMPGGAMPEDHPRSRGDYLHRRQRRIRRIGSPPLTRGLLCKAFASVCADGITPAHAGTTPTVSYSSAHY